MNIELKRIHFSERLSEETNAFTADLWIDGKKVGYCKNDGRGGCTDIHGYTAEGNQIIRDCDAWCKENLPKQTFNVGGVEKTYDTNLEVKVDELFEEWALNKEATKTKNKIKKLSETSIIVGVPNSGSFTYYKQTRPLRVYNRESLQRWIDQIKARDCVDGKVILNENLAELGLVV